MSTVPNMEEAAAIAAEYISTLDNLPNEVQFLLAEIRHRETKSQEIQHAIDKETSKFIKHTLRASSSGSSTPNPNPERLNSNILSGKVASSYALLDELAGEKIVLAQRLVTLIERATARLDHDLSRVLIAQGEADPSVLTAGPSFGTGAAWALGAGAGTGLGISTARNPVREVNERLAGSIALPEVPNIRVDPTPVQKRRKLTGQASSPAIKLPSPVPPVQSFNAASPAPGRSSRLSQQIHIPPAEPRPGRGRRSAVTIKLDHPKEEEEEDAEGEEDIDAEADEAGEEGEEGDPEDKALYCYCQKLSYGEMVGCENPECPYQWFHLSCLNVKGPLPDLWYCDACIKSGAAGPGYTNGSGTSQTTGRKRNRK